MMRYIPEKPTIILYEKNGSDWDTIEFDLEELLDGDNEGIKTENSRGWPVIVRWKKG